MNKSKLLQSIFIILTFLFAVYGKRALGSYLPVSFDSALLSILYSYAWWIIPICLATGLLFGFRNILKELCLDTNIITGLLFSLVVVSPMFISSAIVGHVDRDLGVLTILHKTLFAGFMEELLFRGFLFGLLFRKVGWGYIPASILGAVIFAMNHLSQGSGVGELMGIFFVTFIGSAWFAWLFIEWKENLWIPIMLHLFMNLSWTLFNVSDNALGGVYTNVFRIVTIALTVVATIIYNKQKDRFRIKRTNLWRNAASGIE